MSSYSRRDLVRAASLVPFSAVRGTAANNALKVGLIGSGGRGTFDAGFVVKDPNARRAVLRIERRNDTVTGKSLRDVTWEEVLKS